MEPDFGQTVFAGKKGLITAFCEKNMLVFPVELEIECMDHRSYEASQHVSKVICKQYLTTNWMRVTQVQSQTDTLSDLCYSRSRLLSDSGSENARLDSAGPPFTLSRRERTLFCRFLAKRARRIFHIAASLRLATLVRTAVMAVKNKLEKILNLIVSTIMLQHGRWSWCENLNSDKSSCCTY